MSRFLVSALLLMAGHCTPPAVMSVATTKHCTKGSCRCSPGWSGTMYSLHAHTHQRAALMTDDTNARPATAMGSMRHLLVDDGLLQNKSGLSFQQQRPQSITDEPVVVPDAEWERGCWISWYNSVVRDPSGALRVYYSLYCEDPAPESGSPLPNATKVLTALSVAISHDNGTTFKKPVLHLHSFRNSTANNLVLFAGGVQCIPQCGGEMEGGSVWLDEHAPPSERYKNLAKSTWPSQESGIHLWVSPDGFQWNFRATWTVGRVDTQEVAFYDSSISEYVVYTRANTDNYPVSVRRLNSSMLPGNSSWGRSKDAGLQLPSTFPDLLDRSTHPFPTESSFTRYPTEMGGATVWKVEDTVPPTYFMLIQQHWPWRLECRKHTKGCADEGCAKVQQSQPCFPVDVRLATSRDGVTFSRTDARQPLLGLGLAGSWRSRGMWALPQPVIVNVSSKFSGTTTPELRLFFHGRNVDNRNRIDPATLNGQFRAGIGFARFRLDGLQGLHAGYGARGFATTKLLTFGSTTNTTEHLKYFLLLNADCSAGGVIFVEIQDAAGAAIPGFSRQQAIPTATNSLEAIAQWRAGGMHDSKPLSDLKRLEGVPIRLRIEMEDATLFSFRFQSATTTKNAEATVPN